MLDDGQVQVDRTHYTQSYDTIERFNSYFQQISIIQSLKPNSVLEIGIGNKTVCNYLKNQGFEVTTCDFDEALNPDYVADIRNLPFDNNSFDCVMACQILEHLPWNEVDKALREVHRVAKSHVVISVPEGRNYFELIFRMPLLLRFFKRDRCRLILRFPGFFKKDLVAPKEHYWEMGLRGITRDKVREKVKKIFDIVMERVPCLNPYHYFFVLRKNGAESI